MGCSPGAGVPAAAEVDDEKEAGALKEVGVGIEEGADAEGGGER